LNVHITEWTGEKGAKQPHLFTAADGAPVLAFAGLWDRWRDPATREEILSCTIIVSDASVWMEAYHDRMPVLLEEKDFDAWLDGALGPDALKPGDVSPNPRKFRQVKFSPATIASRSITCPLSRKV
jgi:putative SOS response-associated peptidase YedK